ncbi:hypothetical protein [Comamonas testosteroni]|jgi:hypothetical protein|uniref:hypothetical protein n=1 Tax=Comamonas testosteroni TaxID=285 RepID=UPI0026F01354|nr:hypothetical protein [Comamonas testosteroni]
MLLSKIIGLVITMTLAACAWALYSMSLNNFDEEVKDLKAKEEVVVSVSPAGIVQGGTQVTDRGIIFSSSYTSFETDKGAYQVHGSHIVQKGLSAEVQLRGTGSKFFCVGDGNCMRLSAN